MSEQLLLPPPPEALKKEFDPNLHGSEMQIDPNAALLTREQATEQYGIDAAVVADLQLGSEHSNKYLVLDLGEEANTVNVPTPILADRRESGKLQDRIARRYIIAEGRLGEDGAYHFSGEHIKGMKVGENVQLGRNHNKDRFTYLQTTSSDHLSINLDSEGKIHIKDTSTNGTQVEVAPQPTEIAEETTRNLGSSMLRSTFGVGREDLAGVSTPNQDPATDEPNSNIKSTFKPPQAMDVIAENVSEEVSGLEQVDQAETPKVASQDLIHLNPDEDPEVNEILENGDNAGVEADNINVVEAQQQVDEAFSEEPEVSSEPEKLTPDLSEVFASKESFDNTIANPEVDDGLKNDLKEINNAWQKIKLSEVANTAWDELISPRLRNIEDVAPDLIKKSRITTETVEQTAKGLQRLAQAIDGGDINEVSDVVRRFRFGKLNDDLQKAFRSTANQNELSDATKALAIGDLERDERVTAIRKGVQSGASQEMIDSIQVYLEQRMDISQIKESLVDGASKAVGNPARAKEAIEDLLRLGKLSDQELSRNNLRTLNALDQMLEEARRGRYDAAEVYQISRMVAGLQEELETVQRMGRYIQMSAEEARRNG